MPPVLDVVIGVVFVFLLFSLVVSALNEIILSTLDRRARFLKEGIDELLRDSGANATITPDALFQHGLIAVLSRGKYVPGADPKGTTGVPSYIPGKSFVLAMLSLLTKGADPEKFKPDLRATISDLQNIELRQTLLALYDDAGADLGHFKANLENWFNESMDRVGGWYKRHAQQWLLVLGLILAVACNVNALRLIQTLSSDPKLRESVVTQAVEYASHRSSEKGGTSDVTAGTTQSGAELTPPGAQAVKSPSPGAEDTAQPAAGDTQRAQTAHPEKSSQELVPEIERFKSNLKELGGTGLPIGWTDPQSQQLFTKPELATWLAAIFGWGVMGLAGSLGAPFWFDLLNRFIDIRGVGRAPEEGDPTAPKKPATGVESYVITGDSLSSSKHPPTPAEEEGETPQKPPASPPKPDQK